MYLIGLAMLFLAVLIQDSTIITATLIIAATSICAAKYLIDRKRTCRSSNFHKFNI